MACCILLAFKLNEQQENVVKSKYISSFSAGPSIADIWEPIESTLNVNRKNVVKSEFTVFSLLGFSMHLRVAEVMPNFYRCLRTVNIDREVYIDSDMWDSCLAGMSMEDLDANFDDTYS
jgi:hypothetical protein